MMIEMIKLHKKHLATFQLVCHAYLKRRQDTLYTFLEEGKKNPNRLKYVQASRLYKHF